MADEIIVITGSTKRFKKDIYELAKRMIQSGKTVIIDSHFHNLTEHRGRKQFLRMILDADKLLVYNKGGYIGFHTCFEVILAKMAGIRVRYHFGRNRFGKLGVIDFIDNVEERFYRHFYKGQIE